MRRYNPKDIESKWQKTWEDQGTYQADFESSKPKYIGFGMFNYPSGAGIHVGHVCNFTIPDIVTRAKRQQGYESYQPVGWDSFGLPAENYAIKTGVSPQTSTIDAIKKYHEQYRAMGWAVDWSKEINTIDPEYYKWTQWTFLKLLEHGLAYQKESPQWWCDQCKTVLADEQVLAGKCWRHDNPEDPPVIKKNLKQWFFKITEYADEMLAATDKLNWTPSVKASQKSWIGRSEGAEISFQVDGSSIELKVFTTRPDTLFGATFMVLAPEHPLVKEVTQDDNRDDVEQYIQQTQAKSDIERQESKEKTGVFTGAYAINPANEEKIPIWIADYVLMGYGSGAIMAVPGHDERDFAFAKQFNLPIRFVIEPTYGEKQGDETFKKAIFAVVRNPLDNTVIVLDWGPRQERHGGKMLIGGGMEDGEDYVAAAKREIAEKTGFTNLKLIRESEFLGHGYHYSNIKNKNMHKSGKGVLFDLVDGTRGDTNLDQGEKGKFKVTWQPTDKVANQLDDGIHEAMYRYLVLDEPYTGKGLLVNSAQYDDLTSDEASQAIVVELAKKKKAQSKVNYKMRDWLISRQRYWGAPIPVIHCESCGVVPIPEEQLPVRLPEIDNYQPTGGHASVLAEVDGWVNVSCPSCDELAKRETDTMDGYVCSSWYFFRYLSPHDDTQAWSTERVEKWMPIDFYNGGDHATAHLLYARFFTRFFHQLGLAPTPEPFDTMVFNGKVKASDGSNFSKSKGNGIDPIEVIESGYGADALRLYEMFAAPVELDVLWDPQGIPGAYRFLNRVWALTQDYQGETSAEALGQDAITELERAAHAMVKKVTSDLDGYKFNTAIAAMMEATNTFYKIKEAHGINRSEPWGHAVESLLQVLAPFAPHITEELWQQLGNDDSIHVDHWPDYDEQKLAQASISIVAQVNGKVRATLEVPHDADEPAIVDQALAHERIIPYVKRREEAKKVIYIPGKIVNFVV